MISKKYIEDNMVVSVVRFDNTKTGKKHFYLACAVPIRIRWQDNTVEKIDLMDRVEIEMTLLSKFKFLVGKALTTTEAEKNVTGDKLQQLISKAHCNMIERSDLRYIPDRLTGEKKYFKKIYEVTKKRSS